MSIFALWPLSIVLFFVFAVVLFFLISRERRIMLKIHSWLIAFSAIGGFLIYSYCYLTLGPGLENVPLAVLRAILTTARMYFLHADYDIFSRAVGPQYLTDNMWLQILFWLLHLSAMIVMKIALFSLFGRKLMDYVRLRIGSHDKVYIIKGSDKNALLLGENIATHDAKLKHPDNKRLIVFLLEEDDNEEKVYKKVTRFGGIVKVLGGRNDILSCLKETGLKKGGNYKKRYNIIMMPTDISEADEVRRIAEEYKGDKRITQEILDFFVFTSTEWDRKEIEAVAHVYPYTFHIINETDLLVRKMVEEHPPFKCPALSFSKGLAIRGFTVMIIGFGKVGQNVFLRLVMNGQFAKNRMRAVIIDKNIDDLSDCFLHRYPGFRPLKENISCEIEFKKFDVLEKSFFNFFDEIGDIDYVVVALSGDELNKQTALDIRLCYERKDMQGHPFIAVSEKKEVSDKLYESIICFGRQKDFYKESVIIREETDRMAKAVHEVYGGNPPWSELDWFTQESNRAAADFIPAMLGLANVKNDAVPEGALTKDSGLVETLAETEHLRWNAFHVAMGYRPMSLKELHRRFEKYNGERNSRKHLDFSRKDPMAKQHVCIATWEDLDKISEAYRELARETGTQREIERDFKVDDRKIVEYIPKFLHAVKEEKS